MEIDSCGPPSTWGRILVVAAHPDDEVLALGGHFDVVHPRFFHLTTGACANAVRSAQQERLRARELARAFLLGGIPAHHCFKGGVADQGAVDCLPRLFHGLVAAINRVRPDCLLTHPYEGGHPDHDVAALLSFLVSRTNGGLPVIEFSSYHNGTPDSAQSTWKTSAFLEPVGPVVSVALSRSQQKRKARLLSSFRSQAEVLRRFSTTHELFRAAPRYRFDEPPHVGTLLYESFRWNICFQSWRERISRGEQNLAGYIE